MKKELLEKLAEDLQSWDLSGIKAFIEAAKKKYSTPKTNNMPTYILQKDTPFSKAGDKFIYNNKYNVYVSESDPEHTYPTRIVENNPEWFIEFKCDKVYMEEYCTDSLKHVKGVVVSVPDYLCQSKRIKIKEGIEKVLNSNIHYV